ncbi:MAG: AzlC family ABC transporter permease [Micrococcus sp.]|nr:AzlC family ABC transporter permease [Micrococcus sp.]
MTTRDTPTTAAEIRTGVRLSAAAGLGLFPLGVAFGMLVVQAGLPGWAAPLLSAVVFAGSVELLLVSLIAAGTPLLTIAVTVFLLNFRHIFYALSFPLHVVRSRLGRLYSMAALIDEAYAIAAAHRRGWTSPRLLAMQVALHLYWVLGGVAGVLIAGLLPGPVQGLEFALVALFIVLALDAVRSRAQLPLVALALVAVGVALWLVPGQVLVVAFTLYAILLLLGFALQRGGHRTGLPEPDPDTGALALPTGPTTTIAVDHPSGEEPRA